MKILKFKIFIALIFLLIFTPMVIGASEADIRIYIGDDKLIIPGELGRPFIDNQSRTQIPIRAISEGLGYEVNWDDGSMTATIFKSENERIYITIGSNEIQTPYGIVRMDTNAIIIEQRTYLPLRFISEALGYQVDHHGGRWVGYHEIRITNPRVAVDFYRPNRQTLPDEITRWVEYSKMIPLVQEKEYGGERYILITEGMKPTGGFFVEIVGVYKGGDVLEVLVRSTSPGENDIVTMALTYPYDLIVIEEKGLELRFRDVSNENRFFAGLVGMDSIDRPVVASSPSIKIFSPGPSQEVEDTINLKGLTNAFEGTTNFELTVGSGNVLLEGFVTGTMGDWGYFEREIQIPEGIDATVIYLNLFNISPKDGERISGINIPLRITRN